MKNVYDVQQLLKRFGVFVYTGDRSSDLSMMQMELRDLYDNRLIDVATYQQGILILRKGK